MKKKKPFYKKIWKLFMFPFRKRTYVYLLNIILPFFVSNKVLKPLNLALLSKARKKIYSDFISYLSSEYTESTKCVYLFQERFFDGTGKYYFSGGAERYMLDLAEICIGLGYKPILVQRGERTCETWYKMKDHLQVVGLSLSKSEYNLICSALPEPALAIYSGYDYWGDYIYEKSVLISHGITWDTPYDNVKTEKIYQILKPFRSLVSVDTNTISWLRTTFSATLLKDIKSLCYLPNYVDNTIYTPLAKDLKNNIKISFPRRCAPERGFWLMANTIETIIEQFPNIEFEFVGFAHGEEVEKMLDKLCNAYPEKIKHYVQDANKMHEVYQQTDITLIPTLYAEGTSLSCLEAMACGNIVIATNIGGLPNLIIDGYNGFLINPNEKELLSTLNRVLADKSLRESISQNAINVSKAFDKKIWIEKWKNIIKEVINEKTAC